LGTPLLFIYLSKTVYKLYDIDASYTSVIGLSQNECYMGIMPIGKYLSAVGVKVLYVCFVTVKHCHCPT